MKKIFAKLHLWLAFPFGLIISIMCLSGGILVFENEIQELIHPKVYFVEEVKETPLPLEQLVSMARQQLPDSTIISGVTIPAGPDKNYRLGVSGQGRTSWTVDPYTGEVRGKINPYEKGSFFTFMRRLHRWFLFPYSRGEFSWGKMITGVSTLILVIILVTGMIIWIPKSMKNFKRKLKIKANKGGFRFCYDLHLAGGFYTFLLLMLICLTGLTWSFNWYRNGVYKLFGVEIVQNAGHGQAPSAPSQDNQSEGLRSEGRGSESAASRGEGRSQGEGRPAGAGRPEGSEPADGENRREGRGGGANPGRRGGGANRISPAIWDVVLQQLKNENPHFRTISIQQGTATVATNQYGNLRGSDRYTFNPRTGEITDVQFYKDSDKSGKMRGWLYSLHVGTWGGMITRILSFIACLVGTALPLTGYYFYFKKRAIRKRKRA